MPTFKVTILGPNLPADAGEAVHVHAAGCADITRNRWYRKACTASLPYEVAQ